MVGHRLLVSPRHHRQIDESTGDKSTKDKSTGMNQSVDNTIILPSAWILVLCSAIGPVAMTVAVPANTQIMRDFATEYGVAQLILTVYLFAVAVAQLFLGAYSDRFGRRPVMIHGLIIFGVGSVVCALSHSLEALLIGRAIQGAGGSVGISISRAIVRDVYSRSKSASVIAYISMAMVLAPMVGPTLGGGVTQYASWRYIFWFLGFAVLILLFFVYQRLHETAPGVRSHSSRPRLLASTVLLLTQPAFVGYTTNMAFAAGMFFSFLAGAPFLVMEVMQRSASEYGMFFALSAFGYFSGNFFSGRFAERLGPDRIMLYAVVPTSAGLLLFWLFAGVLHPLALFGPMFLIAFSNGLTIPNATAAALSVRPDLAGAASGIAGSLQIGVGAVLSVVVGFTQDGTFWPLLGVMTFSGIVSIMGMWFARRVA